MPRAGVLHGAMLENLRQILSAYRRAELSPEGLRRAAVLVPLMHRGERLHLLLERRTDRVEHHKNQISFPGGLCDPGDQDAVHTALREAHEEVGLAPADVEVLGLLDDSITVTGFRITPVVGVIPAGYPFRPNPGEVAEILVVPWEIFTRPPQDRRVVEHDGVTYEVEVFLFEGHAIWGATARIALHLAELWR